VVLSSTYHSFPCAARMMASSRNNFGLLSSSQEPSQLIAQATGAAKNRKKREKAKSKKASQNGTENGETDATPRVSVGDVENRKPPEEQRQRTNIVWFDSLQKRLLQDSENTDCWSVWDEWVQQVRRKFWAVQHVSLLQIPPPT
jgi:hypothetical protein